MKRDRIKKTYSFSITNVLVLLISSSLFFSCIQNNNTKKKSSTQATTTTTDDTLPPAPKFTTSLNQIEKGSIITTSNLNIPSDYADGINLRGEQVDTFIRTQGNLSTPQCLALYFPYSTTNKLLLVAAIPQYTNQGTTREYFYFNQMGDEDVSKGVCQNASIITKLTTEYPGATIAYQVKDVCPNCAASISTGSITLYTKSGTNLNTEINTVNLLISLGIFSTIPDNGICSMSSECISLDYNCCYEGQCVKANEVKAGVDTTSQEFIQSQSDIAQNSSLISNYKHLYYICPITVPEIPTPTEPDLTAEQEAQLRLIKLGEIKDCVENLAENESSICTITYEAASTTLEDAGGTSTFSVDKNDKNFSSTYSGNQTSTINSTSNTIVEIIFGEQTIYREDQAVIGGLTVSAVALDSSTTMGTSNDTLTDSQKITTNYIPPTDSLNKNLKIRFRTDGSCKKITDNIAQCQKYYIQGQDDGKTDDHNDSSNLQKFQLPSYADTSKNIKVIVNDTPVYVDYHWSLDSSGTNPIIEFINDNNINGSVVSTHQQVIIQYYVNLQTYPYLLTSRDRAQQELEDICKCGERDCWLTPIYSDNAKTVINNYICEYEQPDLPEPPLEQTVLLDSKTVPVRYFDTNGTPIDEEEDAEEDQEGTVFTYTNNNYLLPNNVDNYIGFNEIYGSFASKKTPRISPAKAARVVNIKENRIYNIFTNYGTFSTCPTCGMDYYSQLARLFPNSFAFKGGGYMPDPVRTSRTKSSSRFEGEYRSDDIIFGRACFVPATMIPWTHRGSNTSVQTQRMNRMAAQHFMFANGYNRDWYGFDYGSIIGSFDGVKWFSIGNSRRIQADSSKLYLAINAYYGDLTIASTFSVTVHEQTNVVGSGSFIDHDIHTDGAQCQGFHVCTNDVDCITRLGWDYTCANVTSLRSNWPRFDSNGSEILDSSTSENIKLTDILGGTQGFNKRCIYRGSGTACSPDTSSPGTSVYTNTDTTNSSLNAFFTCSNNNYCQSFKENGSVKNTKFNTKIARFARPPTYQNFSFINTGDPEKTDLFGLSARILGRPYKFNGSDEIPDDVYTQLTTNNISAMCIKGRAESTTWTRAQNSTMDSCETLCAVNNYSGDGQVSGECVTAQDTTASSYVLCSATSASNRNISCICSNTSFSTQHQTQASSDPTTEDTGDKVLSIGVTPSTLDAPRSDYLSSCNTIDTVNKQLLHFINPSATLTDQSTLNIVPYAATQSIPTNALKIFEDDLGSGELIKDFINDTNSDGFIDTLTLQKNRCLRAPGSVCHTDMDCAPSKLITDKIRFIDELNYTPTGSSSTVQLNEAELNFWKEELVCSQKADVLEEDFDLKNNRCCRESGNSITIYTNNQYTDSSINITVSTDKVPGIDIALDDNTRYSRISTVYYKMKHEAYPALSMSLSPPDPAVPATIDTTTLSQFKTFNEIAKNTCCTENWIRNFHTDNGGGHKWNSNKMQYHEKNKFRCLNWSPCNTLPGYVGGGASTGEALWCEDNPFSCKSPDNAYCTAKSLTANEIKNYSDWLSSLELLGIPQVLIPTAESTDGVQCIVDDDHLTPAATIALEETVNLEADGKPEVQNAAATIKYYRADNMNNYTDSLRKIFSSETVSCCLPAGNVVPDTTSDDMCCTGKAWTQSPGNTICCLEDYTNVSIYLNRYVSSEAGDLNDSYFDEYTGAVKSPDMVEQIAISNGICCSGSVARGNAISALKIPGLEEYDEGLRTRFVTGNTGADAADNVAKNYDLGKRWNNDVYCVPAEDDGSDSTGSDSGGGGISN